MVRAVTPIPFVKARFFDRCGKPLAGGKVYTYEANTTTPKVTYKDPYGLTPNTNPIILDAAGEADIYLDGTYRIRITDRNDVLINDVEKIGSWFSDNLQDSLDNVSSAMGEALKPTLQNLNDTVDAAQVEVNRRVFLLDGAIATAAAAGAGANGWTALLVADESGMTQQQVNDKTALFYNTVADMVADTKLKAGKAVITHGYYAPNDGGGARYLIKDTATDYSIPVANNLHAAFADSFDIRKFGIRNSATLDQTAEIQRMVNYADSRVYEIDFLNFSLMTPKITQFFTGRTTLVGMGFRKAHHLKNLIIANNKTEQLITGTSPILFLPDDLNGRGKFKLSNVKFDPYVSNFLLNNNGEADGYLCGFAVTWHKDAGLTWPASDRVLTNYDIELDDIEFLSPAISYNLACAGIFTRNLNANNVRGDYWGLMLVHHTYNLDANNVHGVFRDDLHTGSGRLLVTNLIHEEAEIANEGIITRNNITVKNSSCFRKTDGSEYIVYKCHRIGNITINNFVADNNVGIFEFYSGDNETDVKRLVIKNLEIKNVQKLYDFYFTCVVEKALVENIGTMKANIIDSAFFGDLTVSNVKSMIKALSIANGNCDKLTVSNIDAVNDSVYGIVRSGAKIKNIELNNVICNQNKLVDCNFDRITLNNVRCNFPGDLSNFIWSQSSNAVSFTINDSKISARFGSLIRHTDNAADKVEFNNTTLIGILYYDVRSATPHIFNNCKLTKSFSCDPPLIPANSDVKVPLQYLFGARIGDTVVANFSQYHDNVIVTASIFDRDSVLVRFTNTSANPIDLPSGTLTVKVV